MWSRVCHPSSHFHSARSGLRRLELLILNLETLQISYAVFHPLSGFKDLLFLWFQSYIKKMLGFQIMNCELKIPRYRPGPKYNMKITLVMRHPSVECGHFTGCASNHLQLLAVLRCLLWWDPHVGAAHVTAVQCSAMQDIVV